MGRADFNAGGSCWLLRVSDLQKLSITRGLCQNLIPLQPLRYFLADLTEVAGSQIHQQFEPLTTPPMLPVQPRSWLPSIQRFLSHQWSDVKKFSVSATKADNALVSTFLWDNRCWFSLAQIKPMTSLHRTKSLSFFWLLLMTYHRKRLYQSFTQYIFTTHSITWRQIL